MAKRNSSVWLSYWLTMCVFILCQDFAVLAKIEHQHKMVSQGGQKKRGTVEALKIGEAPVNAPSTTAHTAALEEIQAGFKYPTCNDWEFYDGDECVCANNVSARCNEHGDVVCDDQNRTYQSACDFAVKFCDGQLSPEAELQSCGACETLRLTGSKTFSDLESIFVRTGFDHDNKPVYRSTNLGGLQLFFVKSWGSYAIGLNNGSEVQVAMRMVDESAYPQDSQAGILMALKNGTDVTWQLDPDLRFECASNTTERIKSKRFIFMIIMAIVGISAAVTTTTLKIVQAKKGCLYYPSLCSLRNEIEHQLKPQVKSLKAQYTSAVGSTDVNRYTTEVDAAFKLVLDIQDKLVEIEKLQTRMNTSLTSLGSLAYALPNDIVKIKGIMVHYKEWLSQVGGEAGMALLGLEIELLTTLPDLLAGVMSVASMALAGIGAVFAVFTGIVDIVASVKQEKKARDTLAKVKTNLVRAKNQLTTALGNLHQFEIKFCKTVVSFLRLLSQKGASYNKVFSDMGNYINTQYGHDISVCATSRVYSKFTFNNIKALNNHMQSVLNLLTNDINSLKNSISQVDNMKAFLSGINKEITEQAKNPREEFKAIESLPLTKQTFPSVFSLVKHIAEKIYPQRDCFWGYNLKTVRTGAVTEATYKEYPICKCPEISKSTTLITNYVKGNPPTDPCTIFIRMKDDVFRSYYFVLKYIADYILPSESQYMGKNLVQIRASTLRDTHIDSTCIYPIVSSAAHSPLFLDISSSLVETVKLGNLQSLTSTNIQSALASINKQIAVGGSQHNTTQSPQSKHLLQTEVDLLRTPLIQLENIQSFITFIKEQITSGVSPKEVFHTIKTTKPSLTFKTFKSLFDLLKHIAEKIYPGRDCLWGYNLKAVRGGTVTAFTYLQTPICQSPEILSLDHLIKTYVGESLSPCSIFARLPGEVFRSYYLIVKYIADYTRPKSSTYMGVDLAKLRNNTANIGDINSSCH